jgi:dihydrofolate synthase / folylpolyglutamate synthase
MFQRMGPAAYKPNLDNTIALCSKLGNPENKFESIHIAGTNGKGSTSHMLASILQEAGYKTGLYTSPHLKDFRERIKINGIEIPEQKVVDFVKKNRQDFEQIKPSFFEMTVGLAFEYFAEEKVDIAVIETGLGGRLDSTNVITPLLSIITNISFDHSALLGETLPKIATEKAGIVKPGIPLLIGETQEEVKPVFTARAGLTSSIYFADESITIEDAGKSQEDGELIMALNIRGSFGISTLKTPLTGNYQLRNIATVIKAIDILKKEKNIPIDAVVAGIRNTVKNTGLKGRWQKLASNPLTICDTGHNEAGVHYILEQINQNRFRQLHMVWGMVNDKDINKILCMLPKEASYYFCKPDIPRGLAAEELVLQAKEKGLNGIAYTSVALALQAAKDAAHSDDFIFVGGSTFVVAEVV